MPRPIPTINTARLRLRGMLPAEFDRFAEIWATPEVVAHITGKPRDRTASWNAFLHNAGHWQVTGFGQWAVQLHQSARMMGQVGFFYAGRGLGDDFDVYPEAGWVLDPDAQSRGLGLEAAKAAHDWFDRIVTGTTVCLITPDNHASLRLAEKLGYQLLRVAEIENEPVQLMRRKGPPQN